MAIKFIILNHLINFLHFSSVAIRGPDIPVCSMKKMGTLL